MVLVRAEVFMGLSTDHLAVIRMYLEEQHFAGGQTLFREGDEADKLYVVRRGLVRLQHVRDGILYEAGQRGPGEGIGETALIDSSPRSATAACVSDCDFFALPREAFYEILAKYPAIATQILRVLTARIRDIDATRVQELEEKNRALEQARDRLTQLLAHLEATNDRLEAALSSRDCFLSVSPFPVILTDADNTVRLINPAALRLFGESKWRPLWEWIRPVMAETATRIEGTLRQGTTWTGEVEVCNPTGHVLLCRLIAVPIPNTGDGASGRLWILEDRTGIRALEEQMIQSERLATKGEMAAEIAHELNNFLAVLSGNTELLEMHLVSQNAERAGCSLSNIRQSLDRVRVFTDNMLNSHHPSGRKIRTEINAFLENQVAFLRPQRKFKKVVFTTAWGADVPSVVCDPSAMQQVFYNLLLNAAEALAETADSHSTIWIETSYLQEDGVVRLRVADDGLGIPPELEGSLFKKRVSSKPAGHGFGLLTIQRIVKDHGGNVTAGPRDGGGAEFTIELPAEPEWPIAVSGLADSGNTLNS